MKFSYTSRASTRENLILSYTVHSTVCTSGRRKSLAFRVFVIMLGRVTSSNNVNRDDRSTKTAIEVDSSSPPASLSESTAPPISAKSPSVEVYVKRRANIFSSACWQVNRDKMPAEYVTAMAATQLLTSSLSNTWAAGVRKYTVQRHHWDISIIRVKETGP
jgi:hypothetical protein